MDARVRQATIADHERIGHYLQIAYEERARYKFPARWHWMFVNNPFWDGNRLPIWLAEADGQIIGQTCEMVIPLKLRDRVCPAAWGVDYIVLPEFRRRGIGRMLQQAQIEHHEIFMALSMSPISRRVLVDLGFEEANPVVELHKRIRVSPEQTRRIVDKKLGAGSVLSRACGVRSVAAAFATSLNLSTRLCDSLHPRAGGRAITTEKVNYFGDEMDRLWARLSSCFPVIVQRDAAYLNWKFTEQPYMDYDKFVARRGQAARGYVITRMGTPPEAKVGIIADLFAAPDDDVMIRHLLVHAIGHLRRQGVNDIIAASSVPEYVAHFLQQGFRRTRDVMPMFRGKTGARVPASGWFMSMGDHDWDQYPLITETQPQDG